MFGNGNGFISDKFGELVVGLFSTVTHVSHKSIYAEVYAKCTFKVPI